MITLIVGTNRNESNSQVVALQLVESLQRRGEDCQILNLEDLPKDFVFNEMFGRRRKEFEVLTATYIQAVDKFIFVIPEYNGGFPGVLKAFIDCLEPVWLNGKKAGMVGLSSGRAGGQRAMDQFTNVLHYLKVHVHYNKPKLSGINTLISSERRINDEFALNLLENFTDEIIQF